MRTLKRAQPLFRVGPTAWGAKTRGPPFRGCDLRSPYSTASCVKYREGPAALLAFIGAHIIALGGAQVDANSLDGYTRAGFCNEPTMSTPDATETAAPPAVASGLKRSFSLSIDLDNIHRPEQPAIQCDAPTVSMPPSHQRVGGLANGSWTARRPTRRRRPKSAPRLLVGRRQPRRRRRVFVAPLADDDGEAAGADGQGMAAAEEEEGEAEGDDEGDGRRTRAARRARSEAGVDRRRGRQAPGARREARPLQLSRIAADLPSRIGKQCRERGTTT